MTTDQYNDFVDKMAFAPMTREYLSIALGGEIGEVLNEVKKELRNGSNRRHNIELELGDSLYYLTALAKCYGYTLDDVMKSNMKKLEARQKETGIPA